MNKALNLLGLARKGGNIQLGEENCGIACRSGKARLLILTKDAGDSVRHRAEYFVRSGKPPLLRVDYTKDELGTAVGRNVCPIAAITDVRLALAFLNAMDPDPTHFSDIRATLDRGAKRVEKRRQEEKAHERNVRFGKK